MGKHDAEGGADREGRAAQASTQLQPSWAGTEGQEPTGPVRGRKEQTSDLSLGFALQQLNDRKMMRATCH